MTTLLQQLSSTLIQFRLHEEIEDKYIMRVLKKRLDGEMLKKLLKHLHANSHISELIVFVKKLQKEITNITNEDILKDCGEKLNNAFKMFYEEYLPHMVDEEKVILVFLFIIENKLISLRLSMIIFFECAWHLIYLTSNIIFRSMIDAFFLV